MTVLARTAGAVLDSLLPPRCLSCGADVGAAGALCAECWTAIDFLTPPLCRVCGFPFELDPGPDHLCGRCLKRSPAYDRARAAMLYDDGSRRLVLALKHADRLEVAPAFAAWMARAGAELLAEAGLLVPVPLHRWRLWRRRYNQAALLANAIARSSGLECLPDALVRRRNTPSQGYLSVAARRRNVAGAFQLSARAVPEVEGRRILLIDDVLTTGATVEACARCLKRGGARGVDVLTLARVVKPAPLG